MDSLKHIAIDSMINEVVSTFLKKGTRDKVLTVSINLNIDDYSKDVSVYKTIEIGYYAPNNYIQVGYRLSDEEPFTHVANHDSCWREGAGRAMNFVEDLMVKEAKEKGVTGKEEIYVSVNFGFRGIRIIDNHVFDFKETTDRYSGFYHLRKIDA